jgi:hypothetical protein
MKLVINNFDGMNYGEKRQIPIEVVFKRKFTNNEYYYMVVYPDGKEQYIPLADLERFSICNINIRKIKTM